MPPPRLSRYLRPCHPPGSAHHVRCAFKTARVHFSTAAEPPIASSPTPAENRTQTTTEERALTAHGEHAQEQHVAGESYRIRKHSARGSQEYPTLFQRLAKDARSRKRRESRESKTPTNIPPKEHGRDMAQEEGATDVQRQLQQLFEQVKTLQAALEAKIMSEKPSPTRNASPEPSTTDSQTRQYANQRRASLQKGSLFANVQSESSPPTSAAQHPKPKRKRPLARTQLAHAWAVYRGSTNHLILVANILEEVSPHLAAPITSTILRRLRVIARDAIAEKDQKTKMILRRYKGGYDSLVTKLESLSTEPSTANAQQNGSPYLETKAKSTQHSSPIVLQADSQHLKMMTYEDIRENNVRRGSNDDDDKVDITTLERKNDGQRLTRQIHTQSRSMSSSDHIKVNTPTAKNPSMLASDAKDMSKASIKSPLKSLPGTDEVSEQSLLEELFPEASSPPQSHHSEKRNQYPKLDLPESTPIIRREFIESPKSLKEQFVESFQNKREETTLLQLAYCSTELTEADFRRLIPKGKHIETWRRDGEFYKVIPGRDPLSLERMPFYYILFKDPESALAYQKNASRLHKLSALHQPSNIFSAIPPPKGFLEDGEDLNKATSLYNLLPTRHHLSLNTIMQPYNPALRALVERGGYQPIMPNVDSEGKRIWKVLMHIEGYEPTHSDLFKIFRRDAYKQGMLLTLRNESSTSIHRLRDIINLKTTVKPISSVRPSAYGTFDHDTEEPRADVEFEDPGIHFLMEGAEEDRTAKEVNQMVMNRVYNRWVIDFSDEEAATRFALSWHRRVLPDLVREKVGWNDVEEVRMCNTEVLW